MAVAVIIGVGATITNDMAVDFAPGFTTHTDNETKAMSNTFPVTFGNYDSVNCALSNIYAYNKSSDTFIDSGNYTVTRCSMLANADSVFLDVEWKITYDQTGNNKTTQYSAAENGTAAMSKLGSKLPLIGTIIILAVILMLVFTALMDRK